VPKDKSAISKGLGRGFDTLLPQGFDASSLLGPSDRIQKIDIGIIQPNAEQPRRHFDEAALGELAQSIKQYGILQPLIVRPANGSGYTLIAGERRLRAAKIAGLTNVSVIVRSPKEHEELEIALVENVQRVDLSPLEQATSIARLNQQFNLSLSEIARRLGKATSTINNIVRLLQLPEAARTALQEQKITEGHGRSILALKDTPERQTELLELIIQKGWSVRQAERFVTAGKQSAPNTKTEMLQKRVDHETPETKLLGRRLGVAVTIRRTARGGKLELGFNSDAELERLLILLTGLKDK
jgi:ParB family chromosome partitioning protein